MVLKLKRLTEGVWFDYPDGGRFKIRPLGPRDYLALREAARKGKIAVPKPDDGKIEIVDDYDEAKFFWSTFTRMLEAWEEIEVEGATSDDEVRETIFNDLPLRNFITEKAAEVFDGLQRNREEESKN